MISPNTNPTGSIPFTLSITNKTQVLVEEAVKTPLETIHLCCLISIMGIYCEPLTVTFTASY